MRYFETHAHYDDSKFDADRDNVINEVISDNVLKIVNVACDFKTCISSMNLAKKYKNIYFTLGVHPYSVEEYLLSKLEEIYNACNIKEKLVAIGEIGLDYSYENIDKQRQKDVFISQIKFAQKYSLPIIIHTRDSSKDTYDILKEYIKEDDKVLLHCFNPTDDLVRLVMENKNYMVAFGGNITYKRKDSFEKYVQMIEEERIVIETDSPYLAPVPKRGTRNDSRNLKIILKKLSQIKGIDEEKLAEIVYNNSCRFYGLD